MERTVRTITIEITLDESGDAPQNGEWDLYTDDIGAILFEAGYKVSDVNVATVTR